ncbi:MAG TPA: hypothetical protein VG028_01325 [Terriglobia bacterium]|nr:hypothetical protein [Terriglobia bacterium]
MSIYLAVMPASWSAQNSKFARLYEGRGVAAESVRQGKLGSCYFHSVMAALAQNHPEMVRKMIVENQDKTFTVRFGDGKTETAYPEDIRYSRDSGYDLSDGLWVAVLFRAYAQRVLRESLASAVEQTDLYAMVKHYAEQLIDSNDSVLIAYDRAIRQVVDQKGNIDRTQLENSLRAHMKNVAIPDEMKDSMVKLLESGGFFAAMESTIQQNGELFGAYRAVGQGGMPGRVIEAFAGSKAIMENESEGEAAGALSRGMSARAPMVACTGESRYHQLLAAHQTLPAGTGPWYIDGHCYTILSFDPDEKIVTLRNPWGDQPYPDGILKLPLASFVPGFGGIETTAQR